MDEISDLTEAVGGLTDALGQSKEAVNGSALVPVTPDTIENEYQQPWDRLPDEAGDHWEFFRVYRELGPSRTYTAVAKATDRSPGGIARVAGRNDWPTRALAWDNETERLYQLARFEAIREMADAHAEQIGAAIESVMVTVEAFNMRLTEDPEYLENLSTKQFANLNLQSVNLLPKLQSAERLARNAPTEIIAGSVEVSHHFSMERDQLGEVFAVLEAAGALPRFGNGESSDEIIEAEVVDVHSVPADSHDDS